MKRLLLLIAPIVLLALECAAQPRTRVDYKAISEFVKNNRAEFDALTKRFSIDNDTTLTHDEMVKVYYGHAFTEHYQGSMFKESDAYKNMMKLMAEEKYAEAYQAGKKLLEENPVSIDLLFIMHVLADKTGKKSEYAAYGTQAAELIKTILRSGDGKSEESAFKVICVGDEYMVLRLFFQVENITQQSLVGHCDLMEFESSPYYKGKQMYFDVSLSLDQLRKTFRSRKR